MQNYLLFPELWGCL